LNFVSFVFILFSSKIMMRFVQTSGREQKWKAFSKNISNYFATSLSIREPFFIFFSCIERQRVAFYQTFKTLQGFPLILHFWNRSRLYPMENFLKNFAFAACLPFRLKSESKIDENYCSLAFWITCSITGNGFWGKRVYFIHNSCNLV